VFSRPVTIWIAVALLLVMAVLTTVYGLLTALISISEGQAHVPPMTAWLEWLVPTAVLFVCELLGAVGLMFGKKWAPYAAWTAVIGFALLLLFNLGVFRGH
jgi:hypothetical protein